MSGRAFVFASWLAATVIASPVAAKSPGAEEIASKALDSNTFSTSNARAELTLKVAKKGKLQRTRRLITMIRRDDKTVRSFVEFTSPADVAGTKFLSVEDRGEDADQYIYLPAFKKVKRIVGSQRNSSFVGTDFSYADLDGREASESTWKKLADEKVGGQDCYVIEGKRKKKKDGDYGRTVLWVHKKHMLPMRIDFFGDDEKTLEKQMLARKIKKVEDRWVVMDSVMKTIAKKTQTNLVIDRLDLSAKLSDEQFTQRALER